MKTRLHTMILAALFVLPIFFSCHSVQHKGDVAPTPTDNELMQQAISTMILTYPETSLQDIYKSCFQDYFGPAHIIANRESAQAYIARELAQATLTDTVYYELCGWKGNYVRVNLAVVADSIISIDNFADAFYRSAPDTTPIVDERWLDEWDSTMQVVREVVVKHSTRIPRKSPLIVNFKSDSIAIAHLLREGKYVMHHSEKYGEAYNPHYRIVRRDIFESEILPLIEGR